MATEKKLTPDNVVKYFKDEFKTKIINIRIEKRAAGSKKNETTRIWIKIDKTIFKPFIKHLIDLAYPHLAVVSGNDFGKNIELIYHFTLNNGERLGVVVLNLSVELPKSKPEIETVCDYIPGALVTEREKQEMLGVNIIGIPDNRRLFLPDEIPKGVYPWRRDDPGVEKLYRNLHEVKK